MELRVETTLTALDDKLQIEIKKAETGSALEAERTKARLIKLEEWQVWWYRNVPAVDAGQDEKILRLEKCLERLQ